MIWIPTIIVGLALATPVFAIVFALLLRWNVMTAVPPADSIKRTHRWGVIGGAIFDLLLSPCLLIWFVWMCIEAGPVPLQASHLHPVFEVGLYVFGALGTRQVLVAMMMGIVGHASLLILAARQYLSSTPVVAYLDADNEPHYWTAVPVRSVVGSSIFLFVMAVITSLPFLPFLL